MDAAQIASTTQEQAVASWIEWLNQLRFSALMDKLIDQDTNLEDALAELQKLKNFIGEPKHILGNSTTKHGEIAEQAQVYISNKKQTRSV